MLADWKPLLIRSEKYPNLLVVGVVKFCDGVAEVEDPALVERLRKYSSLGVIVPDSEGAPPSNPAPPADNEHIADGSELFEPKGNASLEEWSAYAIQKGIDAEALSGLKREEVKALLSE